ncbi:MAG: hypothetical protein DRJ55_03265 [Thermoprotei archaeon]|nr:MAG: hypothetical protein DRJ55_03265 [Thermoprotei archaeon]
MNIARFVSFLVVGLILSHAVLALGDPLTSAVDNAISKIESAVKEIASRIIQLVKNIASIVAVALFAVGIVLWATGINPGRGKQLIFGAAVLLMAVSVL